MMYYAYQVLVFASTQGKFDSLLAESFPDADIIEKEPRMYNNIAYTHYTLECGRPMRSALDGNPAVFIYKVGY